MAERTAREAKKVSAPGPTAVVPTVAASSRLWSSLDHGSLRRLIAEQIPRFRARPYLADVALLRAFFATHLDTVLDDDYCWSLSFDPEFVRALCFEGFLPICAELGGGTGLFVLLPKLHANRCILRFEDLHVPKKVRRRALREAYTLHCDDAAFDAVLAGCIRQHGEDSWLHPPLRSALATLRSTSAVSHDQSTGDASDVRPCCFALRRGDELIAGEVGVLCGRVYTSFSGFFTVDGAGAVQMTLTARLLQRARMAWWDMGQEHAYKRAHGASSVPRQRFLEAFRDERELCNGLEEMMSLRQGGRRFSAAELLAAAPGGMLSAPAAACVVARPAVEDVC